MQAKADNYGKLWNREELILAFELYCRIPFQKTKASNPDVCNLAKLLNRTPASVARKLGNFGAFDPELQKQKISGLIHGSHLDRTIWDEFHNDWNGLVVEAFKLRSVLEKDIQQETNVPEIPIGPSEKMVQTKQRVYQSFFRETVLSSYAFRCCITGLKVPECLVAGHIVPWRIEEHLRADPTNGLCLSGTFHLLFDAGLISVSPNFTVCISKKLLKKKDEATEKSINCFEGKPIIMPYRFVPHNDHLEWHMKNIFIH